MSEETVTFNLELNVEPTVSNVRRVETALYRAIGIYQRLARLLGLPENAPVNQLIEATQRVVMAIRMVQSSLIMLTTGPFGVVLGALGLMSSFLSIAEMSEGY